MIGRGNVGRERGQKRMTAAKKAGERGELTGGRLLWPGAHGSGGTRDEAEVLARGEK
jgi:hypothetical protein